MHEQNDFFLCRTVPHATRNNKPRLTASDQKFKILFNKNTENENRNEHIKEKTEVFFVFLSLSPPLITTNCSVWLVSTNTIVRSACICMFCMYSVCEWHTIAESRIEIYSNVFVMVCVSHMVVLFIHTRQMQRVTAFYTSITIIFFRLFSLGSLTTLVCTSISNDMFNNGMVSCSNQLPCT